MGYAEEAMPDIERRISALESKVAELRAKMDALEREVSELRAKMDALEREVSELRAKMEGTKGEIETQVRDRVEEVEMEKARQELMAIREQLLREDSTKRIEMLTQK